MDKTLVYGAGFVIFITAIAGLLFFTGDVTGTGYFRAFGLIIAAVVTLPFAGAFISVLINPLSKLAQKQFIYSISVGMYVAAISLVIMTLNKNVWNYVAVFLFLVAVAVPAVLALYTKRT